MSYYEEVQSEIKRELDLRERERNVKRKEKELEERERASSKEKDYNNMSDEDYYKTVYKK